MTHSARNRSGTETLGGPPPDALKRYAAGRVCARPGCGTVLNPYNRMNVCYQHDGYGVQRPVHQCGPKVDAAACREHLLALNAAGMWWTEIGRRCEVGEETVRRIARGRTTRIFETTAASLMSVGVTE